MKFRAFTLVELLVVIVIISMLVALIVPAVISSRDRARIAQCMNNQHELSIAISSYDLAKKCLPGVLNVNHDTIIGWPPTLLPFIGREDLWKDIVKDDNEVIIQQGWRYGYNINTTPTPKINIFVCPNDNDISVDCPLSYVVNLGLYNANPNNTFHQNGQTGSVIIPGLFRDCSNNINNKISLSSISSPSTTVILGEKIITMVSQPGDYIPATPPIGRQWIDTDYLKLGFSWPNYPAINPKPEPEDVLRFAQIGQHFLIPPASVKYWAPLPSTHPGIVIITFADGHTDIVSNDVSCEVYKAL
jgi:prepilin-type N-terminal cleavage/methylation domain-containing protein